MAQGKGSNVQLRWGVESSFGVPTATYKSYPYIPTFSLDPTQNQNQSAVMTGDRDESEPFLGFKSASGAFSIPLDTDLIGEYFKNVLGTVATAGAGPYTHTFTKASEIPSIFIEKAHTDTGDYFLGNGMKFNQMTVTGGGEDEVKLDFELIGREVSVSGAEQGTPTDAVEGSFYQPFESTMTGATAVKNATITFNNNLDGDSYIMDGTGARFDIPEGLTAVSGSFEILYQDRTLLEEAIANTTKSFSLAFTQGTNSVTFQMQEVKLEPTGAPVDSPLGLTQNFNFRAFFKSGSNGSALTIILVNDIVSY